MNIKGKIGITLGSIAALSTMIVLCLTSYGWFTNNARLNASGMSVDVDYNTKEELLFNFDLYKHDIDDYQHPTSGYMIEKEEDGTYKAKMNSYDSIFDNLAQCGIVMRARITRLKDAQFTGTESFTVTFARDASQDGDGNIFSARTSSVVEIEATENKPAGLADDETDDSKVYSEVSNMFLNNSYTVKTFADISTHTKTNVSFTFGPDASRAGKTSFVMYFYITYNMPLVTLYQNEHYTEINPLAETIQVESDIDKFMVHIGGDPE